MEYKKLVAVTGMPGLFELINTRGDGAVVRSLDDQKTSYVSGRVHQFTSLESIEVFTQRDNVNLSDVFTAMGQSGSALPDTKDGAAVKKYFEKVYPEMDFDRVYQSDMKKMIRWYEQLKKHNIDINPAESPEEKSEEPVKEKEEAPGEENPPEKKTSGRKKK